MKFDLKKFNPKYSFSMRISIAVLLITSALLLVIGGIGFELSRRATMNEAKRHAESELGHANAEIEKILVSVASTVDAMRYAVLHSIDHPDTMYHIACDVLRSNPNIVSSTIAFEPNYFPKKGYFYAPTMMWSADTLRRKQLGTADYRYHQMEWYRVPKETKMSYWCEPYYDKGGNDYLEVTYSSPIELNGQVIGIITADVTLERLTDIVNRIKVYPHSYNFMLSRSGTYITHPQKGRIMSQTFFTANDTLEDALLRRVGVEMVEGKSGSAEIERDDDSYYIFYEPLGQIGWSTAIVCPEDDIFADAHKLGRALNLILVLGLLLLVFTCYKTVRHFCAPLREFSKAAQNVAKGNFETRIPKPKAQDELRNLRDSLVNMQKSLVTYVDQLQTVTASKERIESELRIAHQIQMYMIPRIFPPFPERTEIDIYATLQPAKEVGGDFYDFQIEDDHLYFIIGDVAGKGVPASLVMAVSRTLFRIIAPREREVEKIAEALNDAMVDGNESALFVTLFIGDLDLKTGYLEYCNAGHNPPVLRLGGQDSTEYMHVVSNLPIGALKCMKFQKESLQLTEKSMLFLYTDGLTEAEDARKEQYGEERLMKYVRKNDTDTDAETIVKGVLADVTTHVSGSPQSDDLTMLVIRYL